MIDMTLKLFTHLENPIPIYLITKLCVKGGYAASSVSSSVGAADGALGKAAKYKID